MKKNNKSEKHKKILIISLISIFIITSIFGVKSIIEQKEIETTYENAIIYVKEKEYTKAIDTFNKVKDYKDSKQQITKTYYLYAKEETKNRNYDKALKLYKKCIEYEDTKDLIIETKYNYAMSLIENHEKKAIELLREIPDFKDVKTYIDNYDFKHRFDGTYFTFTGNIDSAKEKNPSYRIVIDGLKQNATFTGYQYNIDDIYLNGYTYYKGRFNTYINKLVCDDTFSTCKQIVLSTVDENKYYQQTFDENAEDIYKISTYVFSKDLITKHTHYIKKIYSFDVDSTITYKKISNAVELPPERQDTQKPQEPRVGMTKEEVERSTWGYPRDINKNTYSWGTTEQWVYNDNKYIYFENGKVTSISE